MSKSFTKQPIPTKPQLATAYVCDSGQMTQHDLSDNTKVIFEIDIDLMNRVHDFIMTTMSHRLYAVVLVEYYNLDSLPSSLKSALHECEVITGNLAVFRSHNWVAIIKEVCEE